MVFPVVERKQSPKTSNQAGYHIQYPWYTTDIHHPLVHLIPPCHVLFPVGKNTIDVSCATSQAGSEEDASQMMFSCRIFAPFFQREPAHDLCMDVPFIISSPSTSWSLSIRFVSSINIVLIDPHSTFCSDLLGHLHKETDPDPLRATRKDGEGILR